jgi:hypothetical protein
MQMARCGIERQRLDEGDHARVEGGEVDDRAEDVGEGDVGAAAPRGERDPGDLLGLDARGDCRVAEQGRGDAEARDGLAHALAEELAAECHH